MNYNNSREINLEFNEAISRVREALKNEGFGILTEIDVKSTLKNKLGVDYEDYVILGACNPPFAYKALQAEKEIGLLLPCNVIVYRKDGKTFVSSINPEEAMSMVENQELKEIACQVGEKLRKVVDSL
jgi:uncharacterized protein (DUF302 family)